MISFQLSWEPEEIEWDEAYSPHVAEVFWRFIQRSVEAGYNEEGERFPPGIDMIQSGDMLYFRVSIQGLELHFEAPYAELLHARYRWAGIAPQLWDEFLEEVQPLIEAGLHFKE